MHRKSSVENPGDHRFFQSVPCLCTHRQPNTPVVVFLAVAAMLYTAFDLVKLVCVCFPIYYWFPSFQPFILYIGIYPSELSSCRCWQIDNISNKSIIDKRGVLPLLSGILFVMFPHANNFNGAFALYDLIYQSVLNIDSSGIHSPQITDQFLIGRRILKRVYPDNINQLFCFSCQSGLLKIRDIFYRKFRVKNNKFFIPNKYYI